MFDVFLDKCSYIYFLFQPWHMSAAALNAFHNVWLRQATNNSDLTLTVNNHPLPRTVDAEVCIVYY